jgi:16S rRNA (uracil1498-N3)-methyltransferase
MSDLRCFSPGLDSNEIILSPFESHHLVSTNRARQGDVVVLFNGNGLEWDATLVDANRKGARLVRDRSREFEPRASHITLAIALIKGKTFDTILRQATELGVFRIQPLVTERTQVQVKDIPSKLGKWRTQLVEGCKQSGNPWLPELSEPTPFFDFVEDVPAGSAVVASLTENAKSWDDISVGKTVTLYIGPEGDFSQREYQYLDNCGVQAVRLATHVLRSETAVVTALSQLTLKMG